MGALARGTEHHPLAASQKIVAVVGGGIAGLVAAESLLSSRRDRPEVVLVERAPRCGGVVETRTSDGWLVERSADNFLAARPEGMALVERLGLAGELISVEESSRRALVCCRGQTLPVPTGFRLLAPGDPEGIRATDILSPEGKARVLAERSVPRRQAGSAALRDESLESFAVRRLGREAFDRLVQPLVAGIWTADPAKLSMAAACPEFLRMEEEHGSLSVAEEQRLRLMGGAHRGEGARYGQFVTLASGMGAIPTRLAETLRRGGIVERRATATEISRESDGRWRIVLTPADGAEESIVVDGVVVALPAPAAAKVVADPPLAAELAGIEYAGSVVVVMGYGRGQIAHPLSAAGLVVPRIEGHHALAVSFSSSKFPGRAPVGHVLLRVFFGGALDPERSLLDDDRLVALAREELRALVGADGPPSIVEVARWPGAMPQYHLGHLDRLSRIESRLRELPGLALAGAAYEGVGIPQVIASGQAAAGRVLASIAKV